MISISTENIKQKNNNKPSFFMDNSNEYKKYTNHIRNKTISNALHHYADSQKLATLFLTLTAEKNNDNKGLSKNELNNKFQYIQKELKKNNILNYGIKSLELTKNKIYHMHIILFCFKEDIEKIHTITNRKFLSDTNKNELSFQKVFCQTTQHIIQYIHKIEFQNNQQTKESKLISYSEISFFGINKVIKEYDRIYKKDFSDVDFSRYQRLGILENIKRDLKINHLIKSKRIFTALAELGTFTKLSKKINARKWKQQKTNSQKIRKLFSRKLTSPKTPVRPTRQRGNWKNTNITKKERLNYLSYIPPPIFRWKESLHIQKFHFLNAVFRYIKSIVIILSTTGEKYNVIF